MNEKNKYGKEEYKDDLYYFIKGIESNNLIMVSRHYLDEQPSANRFMYLCKSNVASIKKMLKRILNVTRYEFLPSTIIIQELDCSYLSSNLAATISHSFEFSFKDYEFEAIKELVEVF